MVAGLCSQWPMVQSAAKGRSNGCGQYRCSPLAPYLADSVLRSVLTPRHVCQRLLQTWCQNEDRRHLPCAPKLYREMQPAKLNVFSPAPSLFLGPETTGISKLSLLSLGRRVWKGPPTRLEHKVASEYLTRHTGVGFFSRSQLGAD